MNNSHKHWSLWYSAKSNIETLLSNTPFEPALRWMMWKKRTFGHRGAIASHRQMIDVMKRSLRKDSNCVDIGAHKGKYLYYMCKFAPNGTHFAFEPLPSLAKSLRERFAKVTVHETALSDYAGQSTFCHVITNPGLSSLVRQPWRSSVCTDSIVVQVDTLDNVLPKGLPLDFIKIDVEGAELAVLQGGMETIRKNRPLIVFEYGEVFAKSFGTTTEMIYELVTKGLSLKISLLGDWIEGRGSLAKEDFIASIPRHNNFLAHP
jgi:FkbM family methyltransferase